MNKKVISMIIAAAMTVPAAIAFADGDAATTAADATATEAATETATAEATEVATATPDVTVTEDVPAETPATAESTALNSFYGTVTAVDKDSVSITVDNEGTPVDVTFKLVNTVVLDNKGNVIDEESADAQKVDSISLGDYIIVFSTSELLTKDVKAADVIVQIGDLSNRVAVTVDTFNKTDEGLANSDNSLIIYTDDADEIAKYDGKQLAVYYDFSTLSLPAKTNPLAVVVIDKENESATEAPTATAAPAETEAPTAEAKNVNISFKVGDSTLSINDKDVTVETPYIVGEGVTLVPVRVISEAFGAGVEWSGDKKEVTVKYGDKTATLTIGSKNMTVNGSDVTALEEAPELNNNTAMVPLRAISELFGATVTWDGATQGITVQLGE